MLRSVWLVIGCLVLRVGLMVWAKFVLGLWYCLCDCGLGIVVNLVVFGSVV